MDQSHLTIFSHAYDIIDWHMQEFISSRSLKAMRMIILGKVGVGKSKIIQTITENLITRDMGGILVKGAYTGLAASVIDRKTLQGGNQSAQTIKARLIYWRDKHYIIIDETSMESCELFAKKAGDAFVSGDSTSSWY